MAGAEIWSALPDLKTGLALERDRHANHIISRLIKYPHGETSIS